MSTEIVNLTVSLKDLNIQSEDDLQVAIILLEEVKDDPDFDRDILTAALSQAEEWLKSNIDQEDINQVGSFNHYYSKISLIQMALQKENLRNSTRSNLSQ